MFLLGLLLCINTGCSKEDKTGYVDLFIGTAGDNGQVDPAACVPYGMVRVCPDSDPRSHVGYDYEVPAITGFSVNRVSGIGCGGTGGNLRINPAGEGAKLSIEKTTETASPGYYSATLSNGVRVELSATGNVAAERYYYPKDSAALMTFDAGSSFTRVDEASYEVVSPTEITGFIKAGNTCDHGAYKLYFCLTTDRPFEVIEGDGRKAELSFGMSDGRKPVEVRIALSPIDIATAQKENGIVAKENFSKIKTNAAKQWEEMLSRFDISGNAEEKILFYTSLYRVFLSPADVTSWDGRYLGTDGSVYDTTDFRYYSSWSMWDSYRTKFPLIALADPGRMEDIANSLCMLFKNGKRDWATPFESTPTVRTEHSVTILLDAYRKGFTGLHLEEAYPGIVKEMEGLRTERPDQALETCIDLWSAAQIANILGLENDARRYDSSARAVFVRTWNDEFRNVDSTFTKMRDNGLYQGTRWQYRWAAPQFLEYMGDKDSLAEQLVYFFDNSLNNQGNEPGIHASFILNRVGRPDKAQEIARRILTEDMKHIYGGNAEYREPYFGRTFKAEPRGFLPEMDEDDGTMSAWYVFSSIGLFPLVVGEPWYEITSPLYDNIKVKTGSGRTLEIKTVDRTAREDIIKEIRFNGEPITDHRIDHSRLVGGGVLELIY